MLSNTHFSMAVHVLSSLAFHEGELLGSEMLAKSVGTNPSFLRGLIGRLREAGLVETQMGKGGGTRLARAPADITLNDIYRAVERDPGLKTHRCSGSKLCPVQDSMSSLLAELSERVDKAVASELEGITVADLLERHVASKSA